MFSLLLREILTRSLNVCSDVVEDFLCFANFDYLANDQKRKKKILSRYQDKNMIFLINILDEVN